MPIRDTGSPPNDSNYGWLGFGNYQFDSETVIRFWNEFAKNGPGYMDTDRLELAGSFMSSSWFFSLSQNFGYNVHPTIVVAVHVQPNVCISTSGTSRQGAVEVPRLAPGETPEELSARWLCLAYNLLLSMNEELGSPFRFTATCEELLGQGPGTFDGEPGEPYETPSSSSESSSSSSSSLNSSSSSSSSLSSSSSSSSSLSSSSSSSAARAAESSTISASSSSSSSSSLSSSSSSSDSSSSSSFGDHDALESQSSASSNSSSSSSSSDSSSSESSSSSSSTSSLSSASSSSSSSSFGDAEIFDNSSSSSSSLNSSSSSSSSSSHSSSSSSFGDAEIHDNSSSSTSSSSDSSHSSSSSSNSSSSSLSSSSLSSSSQSSSSSSSSSGPGLDPMSAAYFDAIDAFSPTFSEANREAFDAEVVALRDAGLLDRIVEACFYGLLDKDAACVNFANPAESITLVEGGGAVTAVAGGLDFPAVGSYAQSNQSTNTAVTTAGEEFMFGAYGLSGDISMGFLGSGSATRCYMQGSTTNFFIQCFPFSGNSIFISHAVPVGGLHFSSRTSDAANDRTFAGTINSGGDFRWQADNALNGLTKTTNVFKIATQNNTSGTTNNSRPGLYGGHFVVTGPLTQAQVDIIAAHVYAMMVATGATVY